jgi:hypothetical protein
MADKLRAILASLSSDERQELLTAMLREHFAKDQTTEVEIHGDEGEILGYLMPPGVRACHCLGLDAKNVPPELVGPLYPAGHGIRMLERMAAEAEAGTPTER